MCPYIAFCRCLFFLRENLFVRTRTFNDGWPDNVSDEIRLRSSHVGSVEEPEPVERQLFARVGAGAEVFWPGSGF
jgi:hypothetical protein